MQAPRLFVYGTLLHSTGNPEVDEVLCKYTRDLGPASFAGSLFSLGAYPAAVAQATTQSLHGGAPPVFEAHAQVFGRLLELSDEKRVLSVLNAYEDFDARRPQAAEFAPVEIWVMGGGEAEGQGPGIMQRALCYLYQRPVAGLVPIPSGDWLAWRQASPGNPAHFITASEAEGLIARSLRHYGIVDVTLDQAVGRVLAANLHADRDWPPYDRVSMDGIAVSGQAWESGRRSFRVQGAQRAGEPQKILSTDDECMTVMTGAILPEGCDRVIRIEDVDLRGGDLAEAGAHPGRVLAILPQDLMVAAGKNVHPRGKDKRQGDRVLEAGTLLRASEIGVAASLGCTQLKVFRRPRVAVVTTGDELVPVDKRPLSHQVRQSNGPALMAALQGVAETVAWIHCPDQPDKLREGLSRALEEGDVLLVTGGVSMGELDLVPEAMAAIGVREVFHKVKQKPGKPLWYGITDATSVGLAGRQVFGLPGNPVPVLFCFRRFVLPVLRRGAGLPPETPEMAALEIPWNRGPKNFTTMLPCRIRRDSDGRLWATPVANQGSGDFSALAGTDGFIALESVESGEEPDDLFPMGMLASFYPW